MLTIERTVTTEAGSLLQYFQIDEFKEAETRLGYSAKRCIMAQIFCKMLYSFKGWKLGGERIIGAGSASLPNVYIQGEKAYAQWEPIIYHALTSLGSNDAGNL